MAIDGFEVDVPDTKGEDWDDVLAETTSKINSERRHRTCPRAVKRARHNSYRVKLPGDRSTRHNDPPTIRLHTITPQIA